MNVDQLMEKIADRLSENGVDRQDALHFLNREARRRVTRILDKYSRFTPPDHNAKGFALERFLPHESGFVADVSILTEGRNVPAARIIYEPA